MAESSDDWSSSSEEDEVAVSNARAVKAKTKSRNVDQDSSDSDSDDARSYQSDDNSSQDSDDDDEIAHHSKSGKSKDDYASILPVKQEVLTLGERLAQQEEEIEQSGGALRSSKERKMKARQMIAERLAKWKTGDSHKDNDDSSEDGDSSSQEEMKQDKKKKRKSKHAPAEVSSKRQDFFSRKRNLNESGIGVAIGAHRYKPHDPRFSSLSGHLDEDHFEHNYEFLNEIREKEIEQLKKQIKARKLTGKKGNRMRRKGGVDREGSLEEDTQKLKQLQQQKADLERRQVERNAKRSVKKKLQDNVVEGKQSATYFLKRRDMKRLVTEAKFDELRKRGGDDAVERVLAKRRKKNKSRDSKGLGKAGHQPVHVGQK